MTLSTICEHTKATDTARVTATTTATTTATDTATVTATDRATSTATVTATVTATLTNKSCEHHNRIERCRFCKLTGEGGSSMCILHGKRKDSCIECKRLGKTYVSQICHHFKRKQTCKVCKGSAICQHNKNRQGCRQCKINKASVADADAAPVDAYASPAVMDCVEEELLLHEEFSPYDLEVDWLQELNADAGAMDWLEDQPNANAPPPDADVSVADADAAPADDYPSATVMDCIREAFDDTENYVVPSDCYDAPDEYVDVLLPISGQQLVGPAL